MKFAEQTRVLVAGGGGFLGSHLIDALMGLGAQVVCLDSFVTGRRANIAHLSSDPRFELIEADISEPLPPAITSRTFDAVFNLACAASPPLYQARPEHTLLTSVVGTAQLLKVAEASGARFLLASTSEVYGDPHVHPQPESYWGNVNPIGPRACYDEGKRCAETLTFDFARSGRGEVRVVRIFNTYGPRLPAEDGRVVSNIISQALQGQDITIYGEGYQTRSFCYVADLVDGLIRLMSCDEVVGPVNIGNPTELTIRDLVDKVVDLTRSRSSVVHLPLPIDDPQRRRPDISKAAEVLGWAPQTSVDAGLRATIAWYEAELGLSHGHRFAVVAEGGAVGEGSLGLEDTSARLRKAVGRAASA